MTENNTPSDTCCTMCGKQLDSDELECPFEDKTYHILCDSCYRDNYEYTCPLCTEIFEDDLTIEIFPTHLLITEQGEEDFVGNAGIYKVLSYPLYADGMIEFHLFKSAIQKVAELPNFDTDEFPNDLYYICNKCINKYVTEKINND